MTFQSTRPVRGATCLHLPAVRAWDVSIHAPRAGRDWPSSGMIKIEDVSIHAPRAGRDRGCCISCPVPQCFNPRAPCGARHRSQLSHLRSARFNPRAPCGARRLLSCIEEFVRMFQSTRPVRGATYLDSVRSTTIWVSIHAPRAGRDEEHKTLWLKVKSFNPRAPCGARLLL